MHARTRSSGRDRRRPASACQLMAPHSSIFSGDRPAAARARSVGRPAGCCTKVHLSVFLFLLCSNHIYVCISSWLHIYSQIDGQIRCIWVLLITGYSSCVCMHLRGQGCNRPVWHGGGASTSAPVVMALCRTAVPSAGGQVARGYRRNLHYAFQAAAASLVNILTHKQGRHECPSPKENRMYTGFLKPYC